MKDYKETFTRAAAGRAGLTLIEILIAMGILAMGLFGVLSLFPVAIRNVGMSVNRTKATGIAEDAIYSMRKNHLDMQMLTDMVSRTGNDLPFDTRRFSVATTPDPTQLSTVNFRSFPHLIQMFMSPANEGPSSAGWGAPVAPGYTGPVADRLMGPTFKIGPHEFLYYSWDAQNVAWPEAPSNEGYVPVLEFDHLSGQWLPSQFGWTATFLPLDPNFNAQTSYRVQIAVWRNYKLRYDGSLPQGDPGYRQLDAVLNGDGTQRIVSLNGPVTNARPGDYFRVDMHGVWYRIESISGNEVTLVAPFRHPAGANAFDPSGTDIPVSIASSHRLIGIYDALITPEK